MDEFNYEKYDNGNSDDGVKSDLSDINVEKNNFGSFVEPLDYKQYVNDNLPNEEKNVYSFSDVTNGSDSVDCGNGLAEGYSLLDEHCNKSEYSVINDKSNKLFTTTTKPCKKKKYVSIKTATLALVFTAIISIVGGAALSGFMYNGFFGNDNNKNLVTVQDNINSSSKYIGKTNQTNNNSLLGQVLSTPEIVDKVGPAVVGIINKTTYGNAYGYFGGFYGDYDDEFEQSSGSGVVISSDGYIVTNNHVVENATALTVILNNGEEYSAKIIGRDSATDLAVIKIDAANLTFAQMGSSSDLRVGETAIAIGNPLGQEFAGTTTQGIISGLNRSVTVENRTMNLIQTDAAINPGNSGGALVNEYGLLIGINTVKISSDVLEGLGFAIPIDEAKPIIEELITNGYVTGRPVIGIGGRAVTKDDADAYNLKVGVYVSSITPNGPAHMSGVNVGDIIVECDGEPIETVDDLNEIKNKKKPGDKISIKVYRKGDYIDLAIILGEEMPTE